MNIRKILNSKIDKLYVQSEEIDEEILEKRTEIQSAEECEKLTSFLDNAPYIDESLIKDIDISKVLDVFTQYDSNTNLNINDLKTIQVIVKGIYDKNLKMELVKEQIDLLNDFYIKTKLVNDIIFSKLDELDKKLKSLSEAKSKIDEEILNYEIFLEKIESGEEITLEEWPIIDIIVSDRTIPYDIRKNILIEIDGIINHKANNLDIVSKLKEIITHEYKFPSSIESVIDEYEEAIRLNGNLENIKEILDYMQLTNESKKINILNEFDYKTLLAILIYGTKETVKNCYEGMVKNNLTPQFLCDVPYAWISTSTRRKQNRSKVGERTRINEPGPTQQFYNAAHNGVSLNDIIENRNFLQERNFLVSPDGKGVKKALQTNHSVLKKNYELCKLYGLFDVNDKKFAVTTLATANILDKIDKFTELGLGSYIRRYSSKTLSTTKAFYAVLFHLKKVLPEEEYKKLIFVKKGDYELLSPEIRNHPLLDSLKSEKDIEAFLDKNELYEHTFSKDQEIQEYLAEFNAYEIDENIYKDESIKFLDENFKQDKYAYNFAGQLISRLKVLRLYTSLKDKFNNYDELLLYIITYNSFIDKEHFNLIAAELGCNIKEDSNELSRRV